MVRILFEFVLFNWYCLYLLSCELFFKIVFQSYVLRSIQSEQLGGSLTRHVESSCHVVLYVSCHVVLYVSFRVVSCSVVPCCVMSCLVVSCRVVSCCVTFCKLTSKSCRNPMWFWLEFIKCDTIRHDTTQHNTTQQDTTRHNTTQQDTFDMKWHDTYNTTWQEDSWLKYVTSISFFLNLRYDNLSYVTSF